MRRALGFLVPLVLGLALLAFLGHLTLVGTMRAWFESDLSQRSRLAVATSRQIPAQDWRKVEPRMAETLVDITRDERIMAAQPEPWGSSFLCTLPGISNGGNQRPAS